MLTLEQVSVGLPIACPRRSAISRTIAASTRFLESTFLCEYYTHYRNCPPAVRVLPLHELDSGLSARGFDLVVNIHSFSECTYEAVAWWAKHLQRLRIPDLLIIPNEPTELLSTEILRAGETKTARRDFRALIEGAGGPTPNFASQ